MMNLTLIIVHKAKKMNKLYNIGDDPDKLKLFSEYFGIMWGYKNVRPLMMASLGTETIYKINSDMGFFWNFDFGCQDIHVFSAFNASKTIINLLSSNSINTKDNGN